MEKLLTRAMTEQVYRTLPDVAQNIVDDLDDVRGYMDRLRANPNMHPPVGSRARDLELNNLLDEEEEFEREFRQVVVPLLLEGQR
jgi:heme oxygenase